ncbi:MAG: hypothetical protein GW917_01455, partial [Bdellovibrionales bacterium]|nr:hypothetical protein [Bdellovibrionales bacterium]
MLNLNEQLLLVFRDHKREVEASEFLVMPAGISAEKAKEQVCQALESLRDIKKLEVAIIRVGHVSLDIKSLLKELKIFRHRELTRTSPCQVIVHREFGRVQVEKEQNPTPIPSAAAKTRVLIVDDSKTIRSIL